MAKGREELCGEARPSSIGPESLREAGGGPAQTLPPDPLPVTKTWFERWRQRSQLH